MTPPRKARASDYEELIVFLNGIFRRRMDLEYCHIYKPTPRDMSNNIIVLEDGHIVSCVGIFPMTLLCGDAQLSVGGIGGVSTNPDFRGQGLMTRLLNRAITIMQQRNYDISILWGDRRRYAPFGWENGGRQYAFNMDRRHVVRGKNIEGEIRRFSNSPDDLSRIARLYEQCELRVHRTPGQFKSVFNRGSHETWVWRRAKDFAYVTVRGTGKDRDLIEFGGDFGGLDELLSFLFEKYELDSLKGTIAVSPSPRIPFLISRSNEWAVRFIGMVKILNLRSVLTKFSRQIQEKCRRLGVNGNLTLSMTDSGQLATLTLGATVRVTARKKDPILALSDTEMVRLLFGTLPPSHSLGLGKSLRYLDGLFPLAFYVGKLDYV